jgi:hypothetical protein
MCSAQTDGASSAPILRIEMGGHTDKVNEFAVDASGRWAVTASDDLTARVWDLAGNRLGTVLRPPSQGSIGKLTAAAISSDGERIVVGGMANPAWYGGNAAFVFDRQGRMVRVLAGIAGEVLLLRFTDRDRMLVVGATGGLQIFDGASFSRIATVVRLEALDVRPGTAGGRGHDVVAASLFAGWVDARDG